MVPCQARFRYAYNPENSYDSYCNPSIAAAKHPPLSNAPNYNFAPTLHSFSVLASLEDTPLVSSQRFSFSVPETNPRWRRKQGKVRYQSTEECAERVNWYQKLADLALEHAGSSKTENQQNTHHSQHSAIIPSYFAHHTFCSSKSSQMSPVLPQCILPNARTNLEASNEMVTPALNRERTTEILTTSICLRKTISNSRIPAVTIDALSKRGSKLPWLTLIRTQKTVMDYASACGANDAVPEILTTSSSRSRKRDWHGESFSQDMSTSPTCQHCSFPRLCHTAHVSVTMVTPHYESLANSAFVDLQFTADGAKCDHFITYKSPIPLLEPLSPFYSHQPGNLYISSGAVGLAYFCRTLTNSALMDSLNWSRPTSTDTLPVCHQQNYKARGEPFTFLSHPFGHSIRKIENTRVSCLGTILTPGSMINGFRNSSHAQQVDSIFANRNPRVRRRLYAGSTRPARYPWLENRFATPPIDLASASIYPPREQSHAPSKDLVDDVEPSKEWACLSRQFKEHSCLSIIPDIRHQRTSMSTDSIFPLRDSVLVIIEESTHSAESNLKSYGLEIMEDVDDGFDIESNEEYEVVQPNADDGSLEEWEVVSTLLAETSYYESDDGFLWDDHCEAVL